MYLLVSLFFVIATMLEFALVLFLKRKMDLKREMWMTPNSDVEKNTSFQLENLIARLDVGALLAFHTSYISFNIGYWVYYQNHSD